MQVDKEKDLLADGLQSVKGSLRKAEADEGQFKSEVHTPYPYPHP